MNTDFLEKVVSNIFTNLLDKETNVTTAKVQAIAETSVHYAFILRDTYEVVVGQRMLQAFKEKERELEAKVEEFEKVQVLKEDDLKVKVQEVIEQVIKKNELDFEVEEVVTPSEKPRKKKKVTPERVVDEDLKEVEKENIDEDLKEEVYENELTKIEDIKNTMFEPKDTVLEPFEDEIECESLSETTVYVDTDDEIVDMFEEPKTKRKQKTVEAKTVEEMPVVKKRGRPKGFKVNKKP